MTAVYFKLYTAVPSQGDSLGKGNEWWEVIAPLVPEGMVITAVEFGTIDNREDEPHRPLMRTAMNMHDDNKTLHTICRQNGDDTEIDIVEW